MVSLVERYADRIVGMVSCFDRVVITGTLPPICHVRAMEGYLRAHSVRLFNYPRWAEPLRDQLRANAEQVAQAAGLEIEFIRRKDFRKEERVKEIVAERGPSRLGSCLLCHGAVSFVQALVQQKDRHARRRPWRRATP